MQTLCIMGVSGAGKSTVGAALARELGRAFVEGDDYHPPENVAKMSGGTPLSNTDRRGWIATLGMTVREKNPCVVSCSALNPAVRSWLSEAVGDVTYIYLDVPREILASRLSQRVDHFFDPKLLDSQFMALELTNDVIRIAADRPVAKVVSAIIARLDEQ